MKLKYDKQKRGRIKHSFFDMTTFGGNWWFSEKENKWYDTYPEMLTHGCSSHQPCNSVRAFRRKLKKAPDGVKFKLISGFIGYDVYGVGTNKEYNK